jgi:hypothetical protein
MKAKKLLASQKERLVLALLANDITTALNTVCKARGLSFHLDYTEHTPYLYISRPGVDKQLLMSFSTRTKRSVLSVRPMHPDLFSAMTDLNDRLTKLEARLILVAERDKQHRWWAKLQVHVSGARNLALTILDVQKGKVVVDNTFQMHGEEDGRKN